MKYCFSVFAVVATLAAPALSFAQSLQPLTRAEVQAQLVLLESAGYQSGAGEDVHYPTDILAAEQRLYEQHVGNATTSPYVSATTGTSDSGRARGPTPAN